MKLPTIGERECVPVRLVPFLTRRQLLTPDHIAQIFSWRHPFGKLRWWSKGTYQLLPDGSYSEMQPRDWDDATDQLATLEAALCQQEKFDGELAAEWDRRSVELLPAGVFVWRDELESEYARLFGEHDFFVERPGLPDWTEDECEAALDNAIETGSFDALAETAEARLMKRPGDGELSFEPLLAPQTRRLVFQGFDAMQAELLPRPLQRQPSQEAVILAKLAELGFDAQALPVTPSGKSSPAKAATRKALTYSKKWSLTKRG